jgi:hypothetical protein
MGTSGRAVLVAGLLVTLYALGDKPSTSAPSLLTGGYLGAVAGMLLLISGYLLDLFRSKDSLHLFRKVPRFR